MQAGHWAQCFAQALRWAVEHWRSLPAPSQEQHLMLGLVQALLQSSSRVRLAWWERRLRCLDAEPLWRVNRKHTQLM